MIKSFTCKDTAKLWRSETTRRWHSSVQDRALVKLRLIDAATTVDDLRNPPGNRLEALKGDRLGQLSVRINDQWRICFAWNNGEVHSVEIIDYHR